MTAINNGGGEGQDVGSPDDVESLYRPPAQKTVEEILIADAEDESLRKYKESLLGADAKNVIVDASNPKNVIVRNLVLVVDGRDSVVMDLTDVSKLEKKNFIVKEGCQYRLQVQFHVQREIVAGLKYIQKVYRAGVQVDKDEHMVGSYPPKAEIQTFTTPFDEAPSGLIHRGTYKVKSLFTDDDKNEWLKWEWTLEIKKDWE